MHTRGTNPRLAHQGAGSQGNIFSFRSREKNALDIPSYRSGVSTSLRYFFANEQGQCIMKERPASQDWSCVWHRLHPGLTL